jgi:hypothetical protein
MMIHLFDRLNPNLQKRLFILLLIMAILVMIIMNVIGEPLVTKYAPSGIISFEFAFSVARARLIISSWSPDSQLRAAFIQGLDFLFPPIYGVALGFGCLLSHKVLSTRRKPLSGSGIIITWGLVMAVICDYLENISLVALLFGRLQSSFPQIAGACAVIKFALIFIAIGYILYGLIIGILARSARQSAT